MPDLEPLADWEEALLYSGQHSTHDASPLYTSTVSAHLLHPLAHIDSAHLYSR